LLEKSPQYRIPNRSDVHSEPQCPFEREEKDEKEMRERKLEEDKEKREQDKTEAREEEERGRFWDPPKL